MKRKALFRLAALVAVVACTGCVSPDGGPGTKALFVDLAAGSPETHGDWYGGGDPWTSVYTDGALLFVPVNGLPDGAEVVGVRVQWSQRGATGPGRLWMSIEARSFGSTTSQLGAIHVGQLDSNTTDEATGLDHVMAPGTGLRLVFETAGAESVFRVFGAEVVYR